MGFKVSNDHLGDSHVFYKGSQVTWSPWHTMSAVIGSIYINDNIPNQRFPTEEIHNLVRNFPKIMDII